MMRSLSSAVAGLRTHQTKMDVIGNNIANVNTYGFKTSRTTFADVYYQNLGSASRASGGRGGTNPTQIGYGSSVATIDILNEVAGGMSTDRPMDVYITGDGFLVTKDPNGTTYFTRLGNLGFDEDGNLCDPNGNLVMGFPMGPDGPIISPDGTLAEPVPIKVDKDLLDELTGISITSGGNIIGILDGDRTINLGTGAPSWIDPDSVTIAPDSNINGGIRLKVRANYADGDLTTALNDLGITGATVTNFTPNDAFCLSDDLVFTADSKGNIMVKGTYINADGKEVPFSSTASVPIDDATGQQSRNPATLDFKFNGKVIFSMDVSNAEFDRMPASPYGDANVTGGITDANIETALQAAGFENDVTAILTDLDPNITINNMNVKVNSNGTITLTGDYDENPPATGTGITFSQTIKKNQYGTTVTVANGTKQLFKLKVSGTLQSYDDPYAGLDEAVPSSYEYQATYKDRGENVYYVPSDDDGKPYWDALPSSGTFSFGDITINFDTAEVGSFSGTLANASAGEGERVDLGCLVLAKFRNAAGLRQEGNSQFVETPNSGEAQYVKPGLNGTGPLKSNYLEMSNVDISKEFTDMITTQRGFQANSRIVTVSDEMLLELVNLKR